MNLVMTPDKLTDVEYARGRRLIEKKAGGGLSLAEAEELVSLQARLRAWAREGVPMSIDEVTVLYSSLKVRFQPATTLKPRVLPEDELADPD